MGLFSKKGATAGGFTVTGKGKQGVKAIRKEWTAPRKGAASFGAKTRRPTQ